LFLVAVCPCLAQTNALPQWAVDELLARMAAYSNQSTATPVSAPTGETSPNTFQPPPESSITPTTNRSASPPIGAATSAAAQWIRTRYSPDRWGGVVWFVESETGGVLVPVDMAVGFAPGMIVPLHGLLPKGYQGPLPPSGEGLPDPAEVDIRPVLVASAPAPSVARGVVPTNLVSSIVQSRPAMHLVVVKAGRWIYSEARIPSPEE
jgi:hypothetical protein